MWMGVGVGEGVGLEERLRSSRGERGDYDLKGNREKTMT